MINIKKINHIGIAVNDLNIALDFWRDTLGLSLDHFEIVPSHQVKVAFLPAGECDIELVMPIRDDTLLARSLQERGGGLDHLCLEVDHLDEALIELKKKGIKLIDESSRILPGRKIAFIDPLATNGVLLELYELI